jgi:hypothetical protein
MMPRGPPRPRRRRDSLEPDIQAWQDKNLSAAEWWGHLGSWRYLREDTNRVTTCASQPACTQLAAPEMLARPLRAPGGGGQPALETLHSARLQG